MKWEDLSDEAKAIVIAGTIVLALIAVLVGISVVKNSSTQAVVKAEGKTVVSSSHFVCQDNKVYLLKDGQYKAVRIGDGRYPEQLKCSDF